MVARVLLGSSAHWGQTFAVSKPGVNVNTATAASSFLFNAGAGIALYGQPLLTGSISSIVFATANNPTSPAITHSLGYLPVAYVFFSATAPLTIGGYPCYVMPQITTSQLILTCTYAGAIGAGTHAFDNSATLFYVVMRLAAT